MGHARTLQRFRRASRKARAETGKSAGTQLAEIVRLRLGRGKLGMDEYYDFRVYRARGAAARRAFVGWRAASRLQAALTSPGWDVASIDKFVFYSLCRAWGLPHPQVFALYAPKQDRSACSIPTLHTFDDVKAFLDRPDTPMPMFVKPVRALTGLGGYGIAGYDRRRDVVELINGDQASVEQVVDPLSCRRAYWPAACLFQELLRPHPAIVERCGPRLCTSRMAVAIGRNGPVILQASLRIATGKNMVDNLRYGETGNTFGPVDLATGRVLRQMLKGGWDETDVTVHPDTGKLIVGFTLPDWVQAKALCREAALCFGGFRLQGWDVAFTDRGPALVELNVPFDIDAAQKASCEGMWTPEVEDALGAST